MSASTGGDHAGGLGHVIGGACLMLTLYGFIVIIASLFHVELVPHGNGATFGIMIGFLAVGAAVGAGVGRASASSSRR